MPDAWSSTRSATAKIAATTRCASGSGRRHRGAPPAGAEIQRIQRDGAPPSNPGDEHREASEWIDVATRVECHASVAARSRVAKSQRDGRVAQLVDLRTEHEPRQCVENDCQVSTGTCHPARLLELDPRRTPRALCSAP